MDGIEMVFQAKRKGVTVNPYQRALDNYLRGGMDGEWFDPCEDGHEWKYESDSLGDFKACTICEHEEELEEGDAVNNKNDFTDPVEHIHECVGCSVQWDERMHDHSGWNGI
jgi:hypothetical protein